MKYQLKPFPIICLLNFSLIWIFAFGNFIWEAKFLFYQPNRPNNLTFFLKYSIWIPYRTFGIDIRWQLCSKQYYLASINCFAFENFDGLDFREMDRSSRRQIHIRVRSCSTNKLKINFKLCTISVASAYAPL